MDKTKIEYFKEYISQLPSGNITYKTINGKRYPYYQWTDKEAGEKPYFLSQFQRQRFVETL